MVSAELVAARRSQIAGAPDLAALLARLRERAAPLLARMPPLPPAKALLSVDGGVCPDDGATLGFDPSGNAIRNAVHAGISHKVLFGTDWPVFRLQGTQQSFMDVLTSENGPFAMLNAREQSLIFSGNIGRLLESAVSAAA